MGLVVGLFVLLFFVGIPLMIRLAVFFSEIRSSSAPIEQIDTIPPATPQLSTPPAATSSGTLQLRGYAEAGTSVTLFHNNQEAGEQVVDNNGEFLFSEIRLKDGLNRFYATAKDTAGNESVRSTTQTVIYDSNEPELSLKQPADGATFFGTSQQVITIEGTTDNDAIIRVNEQIITVTADGAFSGQYSLSEGENILVVTATDEAGNQARLTITVSYTP